MYIYTYIQSMKYMMFERISYSITCKEYNTLTALIKIQLQRIELYLLKHFK